ncbi:type II toxin-antitoxin system VapC family toxin [Candidatus Pacearchaeota archaeon]|nr:type II toxin-antitoxin system VapC family toxin [Candidatus Pacearchaeota archaeon]
MNEEKYFFDSYAIIEIIKGNNSYNFVLDSTIITSPMNFAEVYYSLLLVHDKLSLDKILKSFNFQFLKINPKIARKSAIFRFNNKKLKLSYIDCVGYMLALSNDLLFLTGDDAFKNFESVEFVK